MENYIVYYRIGFRNAVMHPCSSREEAIAFAKEIKSFYKEKVDFAYIYKTEYDYDATVEAK